LFLVGGVVRDILIGRNFDPCDIDASCAGDPDLLAAVVKTTHAVFQTKKYGTLTIIQHSSSQTISYEITPFREEG